VADAHFEHPRLAGIYDALDGDRSDLVPYLDLAAELAAGAVLDVGCGTGSLAVRLAARGVTVTAVDPALASLEVAGGKQYADRVRWVHGDAADLPPLQVDLATMTANVAQAIVSPRAWRETLGGIAAALRPGGVLCFETRDPASRAWERWDRPETHRTSDIPGEGRVETWGDITAVDWPLVSFRSTFVFHADGAVLTSDSTLRFRGVEEVVGDLAHAGLVLEAVRDAPDRAGRELVFLARRPGRPRAASAAPGPR